MRPHIALILALLMAALILAFFLQIVVIGG